MNKLTDFTSLQIKLASPEVIKSWSHGEVLKPETINYRTLKPEKDGLFCERIFGPTKDWECYCGKYKRIRYRGIICDKCGVEVTQSRVRRERMGHISLACPVAHIWFFKGSPSHLSLLLGISPRNLSGIIYFAKYLVISVDKDAKKDVFKDLDDQFDAKVKELEETAKTAIIDTQTKGKVTIAETKKKIKTKEQLEMALGEIELKTKKAIASLRSTLVSEKETAKEVFDTVKDLVKRTHPLTVLSEEEYIKLLDYNAASFMKVGMGAEAILEVIKELDLAKLATRYREEIQKYSGQRQIKAIKVLRIIDAFSRVSIDPSWMIVTTLPVLPPDLRPMVQLSGGHFASSDINDLYRRVINRNNRLKHLMNLGAPEIILRNEKRMLQEAVDTLVDTSQARAVRRRGAKELRSLADMLRGKQGRFRQNLLGKRVDYSGRSVIVVGPELKLNQCGLPKIMALEIFKPYVLRELINRGFAPNVKSAKHVLERRPAEVFDILEDIIKDHPVLLNRAPTLHKLGIQAFYPVLVEGSAIKIHPCVCAGYNADFDGDQMAVHVPLSKKAIEEAKSLMLPKFNLLRPADGTPITTPSSKEMALGVYYFTSDDSRIGPFGSIFADSREAITAYQSGKVALRQKINARVNGKIIETTVGRLIFNQILPPGFGFVNESVNSSLIKEIFTRAFNEVDLDSLVSLVDAIKDLGFAGGTLSGLSFGIFDAAMLEEKKDIILASNKKVEVIEENFNQGLITADEKKRLSHEVWIETTEEIADKTWEKIDPNGSIKLVIDAKVGRTSRDQIKQISGMRGLVVDPLGKIVDLPIKSNFREGLSVFEYVTSGRGSRKGLTDTAIKTADAGYLTRRLVDVAHDVLVRSEDCGAKEGFLIDHKTRPATFAKRILGRFAAEVVKDKKGKVVVEKNGMIDEAKVDQIEEAQIDAVSVRSPLTCVARYGVCTKCYGWDLSNRKIINLGVPVGVVAAQSIGEPGTQLTLKTKHSGGVVGVDVTQGLPRVEELFESRVPKVLSPLSEIPGKVTLAETDEGWVVKVATINTKPKEEREYLIPRTSKVIVEDGQLIDAGTQLASGSLDIKEVLAVRGLREAQIYLVNELQKVYESQGIPINDRHFEVITKKMSDEVKIVTSGDTMLLPGELVEKVRFEEENEKVLAAGGEPASAQQVILGVTKRALFTESWLSAASFEQTTDILTTAALMGRVDKLIGLKENVIIGRRIPVDTERAVLIETAS